MATVLYKERQRYQDWFVIAMLVVAIAALVFSGLSIFWRDDVTWVYSVVSILSGIGLGYAIYWLRSLRGKLIVTDKKIKFKFRGPLSTSKKVAWTDIKSCTVVNVPDIIRWDRPKVTISDEKMYSLNGRRGLMIETVDGGSYFIGCQNLDELRAALNDQEDIWEIVTEASP